MPDTGDEISLKQLIVKIQEVFRYLKTKWIIIAAFLLVGIIIGAAYAAKKKITYTGKLIFVLSTNDNRSGGIQSLAGQFGLDIGGSTAGVFDGENIIELLKSKKIIKGALFYKIPEKKETLANYIGEGAGFFEKWRKNAYVSRLIPFPDSLSLITPVQDSMLNTMHSFLIKYYLNISKPEKKLSFYSVSTNSPDQFVSAYLTKSVVQGASKLYIDTKTKAAQNNLRMLQKEADSLRASLGFSIDAAAANTDQTFNLNPALQAQRTGVQRSQFQAQAVATAYGEVIKNLEIAKITLQRETPLFQIIEDPMLPLVKETPSLLLWGIIGGILFLFLGVGMLLIQLFYRNIISSN